MQHDYNGFPNQKGARLIARTFPQSTRVLEHVGRDLLIPVFGTDGAVHLTPRTDARRVRLPEDSPITHDIDKLFDVTRYATARTPIELGTVDEATRSAFVHPFPVWCQHVLDMPIKFPGSDVRLPHDLASLAPAVQHIVDIEARVNPRYGDYYAYLSLHQADVAVGERMRENPFHVDGFQGPRWKQKHPANHSYLLCDTLPTDFFPIPFPIDHLDLEMDDIYAEFERMVNAAKAKPWNAKDFELLLMDAYCVHRGGIATHPVFRTWLRISWETRAFDRIGNTHNPLFDYDWEMVARDTSPLIRPRLDMAVAA